MYKPVECLRALARDMVANSDSGHLGMSLGASTLVYALFRNCLNVSPKNPDFINRDRVVFSAGHCTPLIYSVLHMCGYDITIEDLKKFRQIDSCTPGHPEVQTCGIDCSTGALGQGLACAVGLAMAEEHLASIFNKGDLKLFDHYTYAIVGEGCLMEGVSYEAMSLAGENNLSKLIVLYDCNQTTLDGSINNVFDEDLEKRVTAQGFDVFKVKATDDIAGITKAISDAKNSPRPSFIIVPSVLGLGTSLAGSNKAHAMKVTKSDCVSYREQCGLPDEMFNIPVDMYRHYQELQAKAEKMEREYAQTLSEYKRQYKKEFELFTKFVKGDFPLNFNLDFSLTKSGRDAGFQVLNAMFENAPNLFGGSADLASSTKVYLSSGKNFSSSNYSGCNISFGVREFSMACICTGISLHGGLFPFASTFLTFSDYLKPALRMCAQMHAKGLFIFTHDSIRVGEDGASHEPVEQIDALRSIPNLTVFRPSCYAEVLYAYKYAYTNDGPTVVILSKEALPIISPAESDMADGVYAVYRAENPCCNILASGYEMHLALEVRENIKKLGYDANVYSILRMPKKYSLNSAVNVNCVIECSSAYTLSSLINPCGMLVCTRDFGLSGRGDNVYLRRGFSAEKITKLLVNLCKNNKTIK